MAGVFISHSSKDKPFVMQLATDLALADVPVWLDTWELGIGDSLVDKLRAGVRNSSLLIVVVSPDSVESRWVQEELNTALEKEAATNKVAVIPIQIGGTELPAAIRGRIYADFSSSYRSPFESLLRHILNQTAGDAPAPADERMIPLVFSRQVYLKEVKFQGAIGRLLEASPRVRATAKQFVIAPDATYDKLRKALLQRLDNIHSDPYYSYEFEQSLESQYTRVQALETALTAGIVEIVNELPRPGFAKESVTSACHQFAKIIRAEILGTLYACQIPDRLVVPEREAEWLMFPMEARSLAILYQGLSLEAVDIGLPIWEANDPRGFVTGLHRSVPISIEASSGEYKELFRWREFFITNIAATFARTTISKYVVPQMLYRSLMGQATTPIWDFKKLYYGRH